MNAAIAKVATLVVVGVSLVSAEVEVVRSASTRAHAFAMSGQVAAIQHGLGILAKTVADEAHTLARNAAYDVALRAVRGASALYAATVGGIPGGERLPAVRVIETRSVRHCTGAKSRPCSINHTLVRVRAVETG